MLQPHLPRGYEQPQDQQDQVDHTIQRPTDLGVSMQRTQEKNKAQRKKNETLHQAQQTRRIVQHEFRVIGKTQDDRCSEKH